ncbi:PREDICTED: hexokinase-4-like isoform X2 [Tarenaya hassleriana]|uniref:hexokinase-4-like isoform X2 n=1 Tax=Tarenaya hassleriana TaxID=28532 RepID=UPI00053C338D|nr:PREDICTED: hexokinase-4-like isoform X2 [Tarenaya hassleriana]
MAETETAEERLTAELEAACDADVDTLRELAAAMAEEMKKGLRSEDEAKIKMLISFVHTLPDWKAKGIFYALDVGGTNFRILRVSLGGGESSLEVQDMEIQHIPQDLMKGTSEAFFDFLASSIERFVGKEGKDAVSDLGKRQLGFTFSFPIKQTSVSSGNLIRWTKGFAIKDAVHKEVSGLLQAALDKRGVNMQVTALVNDTVGSLALAHYNDQDTVAAVIIGTGTNAAYVEQTKNITKSPALAEDSTQMVINTEWGNFFSSHLPRTTYDIELDAESLNPNEMAYEKMISGMYLGEIVRRVLLRISQESDEFRQAADMLSRPSILSALDIKAMHQDESSELKEVEGIVRDRLQVNDVSLRMRRIVVRVCNAVTRRAGRLGAAGIVGILKKMGREDGESKSVVAIEGGLYANYEKLREYLREALEEILGQDYVARNVILTTTKDGSGLGAALLAAAAAEYVGKKNSQFVTVLHFFCVCA